MASEYFTVSNTSEIEYEIKKSRFIGVIMPCQSEREAMHKLGELARKHPHANHLAFAWRIRQPDGFINERFNDAGEPSGTAGRPIFSPMEGAGLINTVIGVIRYFGGVKLGTGGLTRAYGSAAKQVIEIATIKPWVEMAELTLDLDYAQLQPLEYQLNKIDGTIVEQHFTDRVQVTMRLPKVELDGLKRQFSGF